MSFTPTPQIQPLDQRPPDVLKLLPLWNAEPLGNGRHGIFLSSHKLKAQDGGSGTDKELIFHITRQPYFGYLENITTGGGGSERTLPSRFSAGWFLPVSLVLLMGSSC